VEVLERELARAYRIERALRDVGLALGAVHDRDDLLRIIVDRAVEAVEAERATLYLLEESGAGPNTARRLVSKVIEGGAITRIVLELGQGIAGDVARTGFAANVRDAYNDPRFSRVWDERTGFRTRAVLCVPLRDQREQITGVLQVLNKRSSTPSDLGDAAAPNEHAFFDEDDLALLGALAAQAALRIEQAAMVETLRESNAALTRASESLERKVQDLHLLFAIERATAQASDPDELVAALLPEVARAAGGRTAYIVRPDNDGDLSMFHLGNQPIAELSTFESWVPPSRGMRASHPGHAPSTPRLQRTRVARGIGLAGACIASGQPIRVADTSTDPRRADELEGVLLRGGEDVRAPCAVVPLTDEGDSVVGAMAVIRGSGDRPFDEDDLDLVRLVALNVSTGLQLTSARTSRARQERLSTIGSLLSGVIHDLKTPMMVIAGNVRMMIETEETDARRELAAAVTRQLDHIGAMQNEVLEFARGERSLLSRRVYLAPFFTEIETHLRAEILRRGVPITLSIQLDDRGVARFDEAKITRVVHNLARNAIEAMGARGGDLTIHVAREAADAAKGSPEAIVLEVTDAGPGLPPDVQERLFQSFVSSGKAGGTGLGLAIVKKIADDHGGSIEATSSARGTRFTLRLPQLPDAARRSSREPVAADVMLPAPRKPG
jgi:signal transduction histidine kinase